MKQLFLNCGHVGKYSILYELQGYTNCEYKLHDIRAENKPENNALKVINFLVFIPPFP
jgi:hypothetical protein